MSNKYHIYIPSKGRASNCKTAQVVAAAGLDFTIVVEPQDYKEYAKFYDEANLHKLKSNNKGLPFSRNSILELSRSRGEKAHWQMDDDIRAFKERVDSKNVNVSAKTSVRRLEKEFDAYSNVGVIAHKYTSFAFACKTDFSYNQNPCSSILVRNDVDAKWRKGTVDDADFALQVLTSGLCTIITNRQLIDTVPHNQAAGGLTDTNGVDGRKARFIGLAKAWPGCFTVGEDKNGKAKLYHKRIWSSFPQRPVKKGRK